MYQCPLNKISSPCVSPSALHSHPPPPPKTTIFKQRSFPPNTSFKSIMALNCKAIRATFFFFFLIACVFLTCLSIPQVSTRFDQRLHAAAVRGDVEEAIRVLDTGRVHVDCADRVRGRFACFHLYCFSSLFLFQVTLIYM